MRNTFRINAGSLTNHCPPNTLPASAAQQTYHDESLESSHQSGLKRCPDRRMNTRELSNTFANAMLLAFKRASWPIRQCLSLGLSRWRVRLTKIIGEWSVAEHSQGLSRSPTRSGSTFITMTTRPTSKYPGLLYRNIACIVGVLIIFSHDVNGQTCAGLQTLGTANGSVPQFMSDDGTVVCGTAFAEQYFRWSVRDGYEPIPGPPPAEYFNNTLDFHASDDGAEIFVSVFSVTGFNVIAGGEEGPTEPWRWTKDTGLQRMLTPAIPLPAYYKSARLYQQSRVSGVSADGEKAALNALVFEGGKVVRRAFVWEPLGRLPLDTAGRIASGANAISKDGRFIVGFLADSAWDEFSGAAPRAVRWSSSSRSIVNVINAPSGGASCTADGISRDGSVVVGRWRAGTSGPYRAFRWTENGMSQDLGISEARDVLVSADGKTVAGTFLTPAGASRAFRWTEEASLEELGPLVGTDPKSEVSAISADGATIVGVTHESANGPYRAFRWTKDGGIESLGVGIARSSSNVVSADGTVIAGSYEVTAGQFSAFRWGDADGDGIPDDWECHGIPYLVNAATGEQGRYILPGANPLRRDIYVEVDAMSGRAPLPWSDPAVRSKLIAAGITPTGTVLDRVVNAFLDAPVAAPKDVAGGLPGIALHIQIDPSDLALSLINNGNYVNPVDASDESGKGFGDFQFDKARYFGSPAERADSTKWGTAGNPGPRSLAKQKVFRYCIFANTSGGTTRRGVAEGKVCDDFMVTLGAMTSPGATADDQAFAFMHELGHTLGLGHGGGPENNYNVTADNQLVSQADINFKPNYYSIMNYLWAFKKGWQGAAGVLDYSRAKLPTLNESELYESNGVGASMPDIQVPFRHVHVGPLPSPCQDRLTLYAVSSAESFYYNRASLRAGAAVDWDGDCNVPEAGPVSADINNFHELSLSRVPIELAACGKGETILEGHNDWDNLKYSFRNAESSGANASDLSQLACDYDESVSSFLSSIGHLDNPLAIGTSGGSNARTGVFSVPYIFGGGGIAIKWRVDLSTLPGGAAPPGRGAIVFDENGDLYWRAQVPSSIPGVNGGGIVKTRATDGATLWRGPILDGAALTTPPIVGADAVYASRARGSSDPVANNIVYALDKETGRVLWTSDSLDAGIVLGMALQDGYLYGATQSVGGTAWAFCIRALDGSVRWRLPVGQPSGGTTVMSVTLVPDVFGPDQHLLCWMYDAGTRQNSGITAIRASQSSGAFAWSGGPNRTSISHVLYNKNKNALYATHWYDYGTTVDAYDPATGAVRWTASAGSQFGVSFNGGFIPAHTLRPDGEGLIFGGFDGDVWSIADPGDLSGAALDASAIDWYFDGPALAGEPGTNAVTIRDTLAGSQIYIAGTSSSSDPQYLRRLFAMRVDSPSPVGERLWEWLRPSDPVPTSGSGHFRSLSVGPDGVLYYFDRSDGPTGSLVALGSCQVNTPTVAPQSVAVCAGGEVSFTASASFGPVSYRWSRNSTEIDVASNPSAATRVLTVRDVDESDGGSYACTVVSLCGTKVTAPAFLVVDPCCPADLNADRVVDDADFVVFAAAYNVLDCLEPSMPANCPSDLNSDDVVDDADFVIFVVAYDEVICP